MTTRGRSSVSHEASFPRNEVRRNDVPSGASTFGNLVRAASLDNLAERSCGARRAGSRSASSSPSRCRARAWRSWARRARSTFIAASTTMTVPFVSALFGESVVRTPGSPRSCLWRARRSSSFPARPTTMRAFQVGNAAFVNERFHQSKRFHNNDGSRVFLGDALTSAGAAAGRFSFSVALETGIAVPAARRAAARGRRA